MESLKIELKSEFKDALFLNIYEISFCLIYFIVILILCFYSTPYGPRMFADSPGYIAVGEEINKNIEYIFKVSSPPIYSILISFGIALGLEPLQSAGIIPCLCFALLAFPLFILGKIISGPITSYIACSICLVSTSLWNISTFALTDTPYLLFSILAITLLVMYNKKNEFNIIILAGAFSLLALMTRFIGISVIILGLIIIVVSNKKLKLWHLTTYFAISILPLVILYITLHKITSYKLGYNTVNPPIAQSLGTFASVFKEVFFLNCEPGIIMYIIVIIFIATMIGIIKNKMLKSFICNIGVILGYIIVYSVLLIFVTSSSAIGVTGGVLDARKVVQIFPFAVLVICSAFVFFYKNIKSQYSKIIWKYGLLILLSLFFMQQSVVLIDYTNHLRSDTDFYENWNSIKEFNINNNINLEDVIIIDKLHVAPFIFYKRVDFKTNRAKIIYYTLTNGKITYNDIISPLFNNVLNNNTGNLYMLIYGNRPELMPSHSFRDIIVGGVFNNSNFIIYKIEKSNNLSNLSTYHDSITTYIQLLLIIKDARNLELRGKPANSLELYNKSLELDPNNKNLWIAKGRVLGQLSHYNGSIEAYNEAIELDPNDNNIRDAKLRS